MVKKMIVGFDPSGDARSCFDIRFYPVPSGIAKSKLCRKLLSGRSP